MTLSDNIYQWLINNFRMPDISARDNGFSISSIIIAWVVFFAIGAFLYHLSSEVNKRRRILKYEQSYLNSLNEAFSNLLFEESNIYCDLIIDENQAATGFDFPIYNNSNGPKIRIQPGVLDGKKYRIQNLKIHKNNLLFTVIITIYVQLKSKQGEQAEYLNSDLEKAYKILNVDTKATIEEIRNVYYKLAKNIIQTETVARIPRK
jgi:curved DNA-binding protein CbpA